MLYFWINTHFSTSQQKPHSHLNCLIIFPVAVCHLDFLPYGLHSFIFSWHHPSWIEIKKLSHGWLFIFVMSSARMTNSLHCIGCCIKLLSRQRRDKKQADGQKQKVWSEDSAKGFCPLYGGCFRTNSDSDFWGFKLKQGNVLLQLFSSSCHPSDLSWYSFGQPGINAPMCSVISCPNLIKFSIYETRKKLKRFRRDTQKA